MIFIFWVIMVFFTIFQTPRTGQDERAGLGVKKDKGAGRTKVVRRIKEGGRRATRWVKVNLGGEEMDLYCDTGSNITIITPKMYKESMGKVVATRSYLRAWGSTEYLDTKGMFKTTLTTASGATKRTWVYVVAGARPEPLLGDHDAEDLGIVSFNPEGRTPEEEIFHHEVTKVFAGLEGCITIHDNLLVYGADEKEHNRNMAAMLERAKRKGVTLKLSKSTVCKPEVKWFGRIFSGAGVLADPVKILHLVQAGKPETI